MAEDFLPIEEYISDVQDQLGLTQEAMRIEILKWTYQAVKSIGVARVLLKKAKIPINDFHIDKPDDLIIPAHIILLNASGQCFEPNYDASVECCRTDLTYPNKSAITVSESSNGNGYDFSTAITDEGIDRVLLQYYAIPLDEGLPRIPWYCEQACMAYCQYRFLQRKRNRHRTVGGRSNPVPVVEINDARQEWKTQRLTANTKMKYPLNHRETEEIAEHIMLNVINVFPHKRLAQRTQDFYGLVWWS